MGDANDEYNEMQKIGSWNKQSWCKVTAEIRCRLIIYDSTLVKDLIVHYFWITYS